MTFISSCILVLASAVVSVLWKSGRKQYKRHAAEWTPAKLAASDKKLGQLLFGARSTAFAAFIPLVFEFSPLSVEVVDSARATLGVVLASGALVATARLILKVPWKKWWTSPRLTLGNLVALAASGAFVSAVVVMTVAAALQQAFRAELIRLVSGG